MAALRMAILVTILLALQLSASSNKPKHKWAQHTQTKANLKITNLQFYFHDTLSGKTPTTARIAQASMTAKSPTIFGALLMADDPLTVGHEPTSKLIGRAQGLYGSSGQYELGLLMAFDFGFTDGVYNGSSISIVGKNRALHPVREMAVVGGTGVFRFAAGYAVAETYWFDASTGDAIVCYNVTIHQYMY